MDEKLVAKRMKAVKGALEKRTKGLLVADELRLRAVRMSEEHVTKFWKRLKEMGARGVEVFSEGKVIVHFDDGATIQVEGSRISYIEAVER